MTEKTRKWVKSKVNVEQVAQNTQNAKQYVGLTEKYKNLGSQIESTVDNIFNSLGTNFMKFDPSTTIAEDLEKTGQKQAVNLALKYADYIPFYSYEFNMTDLKAIFSSERMLDKASHYIAHTLYYDQANLDSSWLNNVVSFIKVPEQAHHPLRHELTLKGFLLNKAELEGMLDNQTAFNKQHYDTIQSWYQKLEATTEPTQALLELPRHFDFAELNPRNKEYIFANIINYYFSQNSDYHEFRLKYVSHALKVYKELLNSDCITHPKVTDKEFVKSILGKLEVKIKSATDTKSQNSLAADIKALKEWVEFIEGKEAFLKATEELHDSYNAFLELDDRTETKSVGTLDKFADYLKGKINFFSSSSEKPTAKTGKEGKEESKGLFQKFFDVFGSPEKAKPVMESTSETEEDVVEIDLSSSEEVAVSSTQSSVAVAKVLKTVAVEAYESKEQIHHEYQTLMSAFMDAKKAICFNNVMQATKLVSSCLIRKPFEQATNENKLDCEAFDAQAKLGLMQCDYLFPFATKSDDIISEYLNKSSKIEVSIYEDGKTGLKSHIDEVIADLTIALGQAIVGLYKALPADSNQQIMEAAYQQPLDKEKAEQGKLQIEGGNEPFPHDNAGALVQPNALSAGEHQHVEL